MAPKHPTHAAMGTVKGTLKKGAMGEEKGTAKKGAMGKETAKGALADLTVVDLTRVLAGPYCTMLLADMGARVIKVEHPCGGDDARGFGPFHQGRSAYFDSLNRGKESIALDLKRKGDRAVFETLLDTADIVVENFRPGTMEKLGYGWDDLHRARPKLILASISGFGQSGPYRSRPAYDLIIQAMSGMMSITGSKNGEPTRAGTSIGDLAAGLFAAFAIVTAVHTRHSDGMGRHVDIAMLDCQISLLENAIARYGISGQVPRPSGSRHPSITPFQTFRSKNARQDDIAIAAGNDVLFARLCRVLGHADLARDPRFVDNAKRNHHQDALEAILSPLFKNRCRDVWLQKLLAAGVPVAPINTIADISHDPHVRARGMIVRPDPQGPSMAGNPVRISGLESPLRPAPRLDQSGHAWRGKKPEKKDGKNKGDACPAPAKTTK